VAERNLDTNFRVELKRIYLEESDAKVRALKSVMKNYLREPGIPSNLADYIEMAHKLAGAGATYGFPVISEVGGALEGLLRAIRGGDLELTDDVRNALARSAKATEDVFAKAKEGRETAADDYPVIRELKGFAKQPEQSSVEPRDEKKTILVVDDDADSLRITNLTLVKAGYRVLSYVNAEDVRTAIKTERPDMMILDVMLPGMSGYDLCREIRKDKAFVFTPVIYVTTKGQIDDKITGLKTGADDYLTKPFEPEELVARVGAHIGRIELMKELSLKDGLTRAFNHRYFQERLQIELGRARRYGRALSLTIVDIDHFKRFNDTYGHQVGDVVLRRLVDVLHQQVRNVDVVCRYGGEEFVVIMPETPCGKALEVVNRIRETLARSTFKIEGHEDDFKITVSAGIASFPGDAQSKDELIQKADRALYTAKKKGRNLVCIAMDVEPTSAPPTNPAA
jgi:diguanylate cyclase (GGDEF)-like protein